MFSLHVFKFVGKFLRAVRIFLATLFFCSIYLVCCTDTFSFVFYEEEAMSHPERMHDIIQKMVLRSDECYFQFMKKQYIDRAISVMEAGVQKREPEAMLCYSIYWSGSNFQPGGDSIRIDGLPPDWEKANYWLQQAADAGHPNAQFFLGENLLQAYHVERDYVAAYEYLSKAGEADHPKALYYLGKCHLHGKGVHKNDTLAIGFFRRAVEAGDSTSISYLDSLLHIIHID